MKIHKYKDSDGIDRVTIEGDESCEYEIIGGKIKKKPKAKREAEKREREDQRHNEEVMQGMPSVPDQLDAIWMTLNQMRLNGTDLPSVADKMLGKILSIKKELK